MKGRILVSSLMVTTALVVISFSSINTPKAQSIEPAQIIEPEQSTGPGDLVYVGDNISTGAGVKIFRRDDQGRLTELPGSPIPTGGKGLFDIVGFNRAPTGIFAAQDIGPWEHDGNLILNADRSRMFIVNQGSDDLTVFNISPDGLTLTPVPGSPFKTGHIPSSVGLAANNTVIVVNKNDDPGGQKPIGDGARGSVMTFKMAANGSLTPVPNSQIFLPTARAGEGVFPGQTTTPSQVLVAPGGNVAFVNDFFAGMIRPYVVQSDGTLKATKPFDIRSLGIGVIPINGRNFPFTLGLGIHPLTNVLYAGLLFENKVAAFRFNTKNGKLKFIGTATNGGSTVCWFSFSKSGKFMWASNQASNSVSTYDVSNPEKPVETQVVKFDTCGETQQVTLSPDGSFIHFVATSVTNKCSQRDPNTRSNMVHVLSINPGNGAMTELNPPRIMMDLPLGERIQGVATK